MAAGSRGFVILNGPPGSGKTTLAGPLSLRLGMAVLSKDTIKESLDDWFPAADVAGSRRLGIAALDVMYALAAKSPGAILESNFHRGLARPRIEALPGPIVEVFCRCDLALAHHRLRERAAGRGGPGPWRHRVHHDSVIDPAEIYTAENTEPVAGGWPVIEVDTTGPVDVDALIGQIRSALERADAPAREAGGKNSLKTSGSIAVFGRVARIRGSGPRI